jgi:hypothetical protein
VASPTGQSLDAVLDDNHSEDQATASMLLMHSPLELSLSINTEHDQDQETELGLSNFLSRLDSVYLLDIQLHDPSWVESLYCDLRRISCSTTSTCVYGTINIVIAGYASQLVRMALMLSLC